MRLTDTYADPDTVDEDGIIRRYGDHSQRRRPPPKIGRGPDNDNDNNIDIDGMHEEDAREYQYYLPHDHYEKSSPQNPCASNQFKCKNNVCIPLHLRCDGFHHCNDMSDEDNCDQYLPVTTRRPQTRPPYTRPPNTRAPVTLPVTRAPRPTSYPWATVAPGSLERRTTEAPRAITTPTRQLTTNPIPITTTGGAASRLLSVYFCVKFSVCRIAMRQNVLHTFGCWDYFYFSTSWYYNFQ